jgi:hypothetical protein
MISKDSRAMSSTLPKRRPCKNPDLSRPFSTSARKRQLVTVGIHRQSGLLQDSTPPMYRAFNRHLREMRWQMAKYKVCGNEYEQGIRADGAGTRRTFDSFECAVHAIAPICEHCRCRVIGHGIEVGGHFFCRAYCARAATSADVRDRAG